MSPLQAFKSQHRQHQLRDAPAPGSGSMPKVRFFDESTPTKTPSAPRHRAQAERAGIAGHRVAGNHARAGRCTGHVPAEMVPADTVEKSPARVAYRRREGEATVERYNGFCEAGKDEDWNSRRQDGAHDRPLLRSSYRCEHLGHRRWLRGSNEQAQALRLALASSGSLTEPIPGLYAAGVVCEWNCAAGATVLSAMTLGRIAGRSAAAEASAA